MRKSVIAANWKMHMTLAEAAAFIDAFAPEARGISDIEIVIAPPFTALAKMADRLKGTNIGLSGQNCHQEEKGAFTGEVSVSMLIDAGCGYVIIGHSERRQYFGETDETVNKKTAFALSKGLKVILCIGETFEERKAGKTFDVLGRQIKGGLKGIALENVIIAYEPVWAIGTGVTATPEQAEEAHAFIRKDIGNLYSAKEASSMRILYGGSVKPDNVDDLMARPDIDGALVGGASLKPDSFARLVKFKR